MEPDNGAGNGIAAGTTEWAPAIKTAGYYTAIALVLEAIVWAVAERGRDDAALAAGLALALSLGLGAVITGKAGLIGRASASENVSWKRWLAVSSLVIASDAGLFLNLVGIAILKGMGDAFDHLVGDMGYTVLKSSESLTWDAGAVAFLGAACLLKAALVAAALRVLTRNWPGKAFLTLLATSITIFASIAFANPENGFLISFLLMVQPLTAGVCGYWITPRPGAKRSGGFGESAPRAI